MDQQSKFYAQAKTILKLFHFPDVHINATVNEKRKVWLQTYVALCFILTRYEIDGNSCSETDIQLAKNLLAFLKNKNAPPQSSFLEMSRNLTTSSLAVMLSPSSNSEKTDRELESVDVIEIIRNAIGYHTMLEKKMHENLLIESTEFREFVLDPRTRFFCSMNQDMLLKFVHVIDQCLWIQFHEVKSVPLAEITKNESLRVVADWMDSFIFWTNKYIQKSEKEVRLDKESIYLPLSIESFMEKPPVKEEVSDKAVSKEHLVDFLKM